MKSLVSPNCSLRRVCWYWAVFIFGALASGPCPAQDSPRPAVKSSVGAAVLGRPWKSQARFAFQRRRRLNHSYLRGDYSVPSDGHPEISGIYRRFRPPPSLSARRHTNRSDSQPG